MSELTFLTEDQIIGKNLLDIIIKYGSKCTFTDFSLLLGIDPRRIWWWTKTCDGDNGARGVDYEDFIYSFAVDTRNAGARPAIPYSSISSFPITELSKNDKTKEIEYGEYPQTVVDATYSRELENAYNYGILKTTGKKYTTDSTRYQDINTKFQARSHIEYEYKGNKYIRFVADSNCDREDLPDGRTIQSGNAYWVRVEPIIWLVDLTADIALTKKIIFSGVQFKSERNYKGNFEETDIKQFMDKYFSKEIVSDKDYSQITSEAQTQNIEEQEPVRDPNPYNFKYDEVSEEDIIRGAVESNVAVFLHGRSSEGKSARVKQLDPDCEIIYMRNATPDSLNGKSVYNSATGEMIDVPPTWYTRVLEKCRREPEKIHIIFFDELTNALPSIQGMAFNIILDKEVNGKWKLPPNARIVAAGNDLDDSLAANRLAEPLFNRFAHVYINTTVDSWLKWASTPKEKYERLDYKEKEPEAKIHPSVYAYIAYKSYSGHDVLRTPYTGNKPNADPRKWEMASKVLYMTNQPEMLRALIGEELTRDFIEFTRQHIITVEDVLNHNYSSSDLEMDVSQKYMTAIGLSMVDDEHFEIVREFMKEIGAEPRELFESMWVHGGQKKLEKLSEIQDAEALLQEGIKK